MNRGSKALTIAFEDFSTGHWTAGRQYLKNLFQALSFFENGIRPEIVLITDGTEIHEDLAPYVSRSITPPLPVETASLGLPKRFIYKLRRKMGSSSKRESILSEELRDAGVDCLFRLNANEDRLEVPVMVWIPDFQHIRLPQMFTQEEIKKRNQIFRRAAETGDRVILSSIDALGDYSRFAPTHAAKGRVLQFCTSIPDEVFSKSPAYICERYHLPRRFVFLPNQFWKHKNHKAVVDALKIAKRVNPDITVVCTGNTSDYRDPLYMGELLAEVSKAGLRDNFIVLGMVDRDDLYQLMRQSLAVLQPSLFEGWSTTVEEVKALGVRIIISDIPVHREQAPPSGAFFNPEKADELADRLLEIFRSGEEGTARKLVPADRLGAEANMLRFARTFLEIATEASSLRCLRK
jgi:glycosyltransferase involved in cell wall biosynthesis